MTLDVGVAQARWVVAALMLGACEGSRTPSPSGAAPPTSAAAPSGSVGAGEKAASQASPAGGAAANGMAPSAPEGASPTAGPAPTEAVPVPSDPVPLPSDAVPVPSDAVPRPNEAGAAPGDQVEVAAGASRGQAPGAGPEGATPSPTAAQPSAPPVPNEAAPPGAPPSDVPGGPRRALEVVAGKGAACARLDDGTVRCWGRGDFGELGRGKEPRDVAGPVVVPGVSGAVALAMGGDPGDQGDAVCARTSPGPVVCWGYANALPLSAAQAAAGRLTEPKYGDAIADLERPAASPAAIPALAGAQDVAFGGGTGYAVLADGSAVGWGAGTYNALANGRTRQQLAPVPIEGVVGATHIAAGDDHACARLADGSVACWGYQGAQRPVTPVAGVAGVSALAAAGATTCGLTPAGVTCWDERLQPKALAVGPAQAIAGRDRLCVVGASTATACWLPGTPPATLAALPRAVAIGVGPGYACAARASGAVSCWGDNRFGQLGDGSLIDSATPVTVGGLQSASPPEPLAPRLAERPPLPDSEAPPAGCHQDPAFEVSHPGLPAGFAVKSALVFTRLRGTAVRLVFSNVALGEHELFAPPRGPEARITVRLSKQGKAERFPAAIEPGVYPTDHGQRQLAFVALWDRSTRAGGELLGDTRGKGSVTLDVLTDGWACGKLDIRTRDTVVKGAFAARFVTGPASRKVAGNTTPRQER